MRIDFYHLTKSSLDATLPALVERTVEGKLKSVIQTVAAEESEYISGLLWKYKPLSFIPHGTKNDGHPEKQAVYITETGENPNKATILIRLFPPDSIDEVEGYDRCLLLFNGASEEATQKARAFWKEASNAKADLFYWQQSMEGKWEQRKI